MLVFKVVGSTRFATRFGTRLPGYSELLSRFDQDCPHCLRVRRSLSRFRSAGRGAHRSPSQNSAEQTSVANLVPNLVEIGVRALSVILSEFLPVVSIPSPIRGFLESVVPSSLFVPACRDSFAVLFFSFGCGYAALGYYGAPGSPGWVNSLSSVSRALSPSAVFFPATKSHSVRAKWEALHELWNRGISRILGKSHSQSSSLMKIPYV